MRIEKGRLEVVFRGPGHQILNGIADPVRVIDRENRVIYVNDAMRELMGDDPEKMYCSLEEDENNFLCNLKVAGRCLQTGEIIQRDEKYNGSYYAVKTSPVWGNHEEIIGVVEVCRDRSREKKLQHEMMEKNRRWTVEMEQALRIQKNLLPRKGFYRDIKVDWIFRPQSRVSGDMLDVFPLGQDRLCFYISDTVGHGFASGMNTMFIRQTMRSLPDRDLAVPSRALAALHRRFCDLGLEIDMYFTMFYGVYHRKDRCLTFANAGHNCPPLKLSDNKVYPIEVTGRPISRLFPKGEHEDYFTDLTTGDQLLLYTDGITETTNEQGEFFGASRLYRICQETTDLLERLDRERNLFSPAGKDDDFTALSLEFY